MEERELNLLEQWVAEGRLGASELAEAREIRMRLLDMGLEERSLLAILREKGYVDEAMSAEGARRLRREMGREQIAGYRLIERIGEGAMGVVYKAKQISLDRDVAIKVLDAELAQDDEHVQRFLLEARAVARLNHTNIISGIDVGEAGSVRYLVMEFADGMTVKDLLDRGGAVDEERVLWVAGQMARALDHAHRANLVHRDVKPANIILTKDGVAKLGDFGLARLDVDGDEGGRMGTADYMSPEQARGDGSVDERTDLYGLGATLFHMLVGRPAYVGADVSSILAQHLTAEAPSVRDLDPNIDERVDALVKRLLDKVPASRGRAKDLVEECETLLKALQASRMADAAASPLSPSTRPAPGAGPAPIRRTRRR